VSRRVLIVEDEILVAADLQAALETFGHEVVGIAQDASEALYLASRRRPDLALVDMNLSDGPTGGRIGRALAQEHGVLVMFITSEPGLAPMDVAGVLGAFPKPFSGERLAETIDRAPDHALANDSGSVSS
jgi:DNA-binding response OmpR family regulator